MNTKKIVLASASPRRKQLLQMLKLDFEIIKPTSDEHFNNHLNIEENLKNITQKKVFSVLKTNQLSDVLIIAADTIVILDETILTKPKNYADACGMLEKLSAKTHLVLTGIYIYDTASNKEKYHSESTKVTFKKLSADEIRAYIEYDKPYDKAGAYAIQGLGSVFVEKIEGCFYNVVGLPISLLYDMLKDFNVNIL